MCNGLLLLMIVIAVGALVWAIAYVVDLHHLVDAERTANIRRLERRSRAARRQP